MVVRRHMERMYAPLTWVEEKKLEACRKKGFVPLEWTEGVDDALGVDMHWATLLGRRILIRAFVNHIVLNPESGRKKYETYLVLIHNGPLGEFLYTSDVRVDMELESALQYAQWQATVAFRLIEGEEAREVGPGEQGMEINSTRYL